MQGMYRLTLFRKVESKVADQQTQNQSKSQEKMGFHAVWSMAVGGMVGGGIFSVLGVTVHLAGPWAWLSFVGAGLIALATGYSYVHLAAKFSGGGGAFMFLERLNLKGIAGSLVWVLIIGYVLTDSVYAFTFGHYLGQAFGLGDLLTRILAVAIIGALVGVNLLGVGESAGFEIVAVWGKLIVLVGLAAFGLWHWHPEQLSAGVESSGIEGALIGGASIFMSYEGFQLLTYDYNDIRQPKKMLLRALPLAIAVVIGVYVIVALGTASLIGAGTIVQQKEIALAVAGQAALGIWGKGIVSIAAALSTGSAINATLFATARLAKKVAEDGQLPQAVAHTNRKGIPDRAVIGLGVISAVLAVIGSLSDLVEAASLIFLVTFAIVNTIGAVKLNNGWRWVSLAGAVGAIAATTVLVFWLFTKSPLALAALAGLVLLAIVVRPYVLKHTKTSER